MFDIEEIRAQWAKQRPDIDTRPMGLIGRLVRLTALYSDEMIKNFAKHGLSAASFDVLATLLRSGPPHSLSPNQLLSTMMVTSGTMTNRIDQLVKDGLVARIPNPDDKRSVHVQLTEDGIKKIDAAVTDHVIVQRRLVEGLSQADQATLNRILDKGLSSFDR
ncbi:putative transcription regulator protein [Parvularcula bermudensis HTCC2503]|uniref:Putative transcription regulator protein n=1 Tax=Parvularcula bermudensis (strain ATCC BAA-594 / HTCC2503 / KCTC 12087) TaxID=314260 RepID=E0TD86_PARBH|nr:MarR family transcriptional regulator [Parvularcula bermudensis]ADM09909.1 putative transcription regulator protein [Parvularcula bermudensis HTCC2503]